MSGSCLRCALPPCSARALSPSVRPSRSAARYSRASAGSQPIANQLADDYRLGELTRRMGLRTVLSDVVVETCVDERSFGDLVRHELRWLRTIRTVRPIGYSLLFITFGVPVAAFGSLLAARRAGRRSPCSASPRSPGSCCIGRCAGRTRRLRICSCCRSGMGSAWLSGLGVSSRAACTGGTTVTESLVMDPPSPFLRI